MRSSPFKWAAMHGAAHSNVPGALPVRLRVCLSRKLRWCCWLPSVSCHRSRKYCSSRWSSKLAFLQKLFTAETQRTQSKHRELYNLEFNFFVSPCLLGEFSCLILAIYYHIFLG